MNWMAWSTVQLYYNIAISINVCSHNIKVNYGIKLSNDSYIIMIVSQIIQCYSDPKVEELLFNYGTI